MVRFEKFIIHPFVARGNVRYITQKFIKLVAVNEEKWTNGKAFAEFKNVFGGLGKFLFKLLAFGLGLEDFDEGVGGLFGVDGVDDVEVAIDFVFEDLGE